MTAGKTSLLGNDTANGQNLYEREVDETVHSLKDFLGTIAFRL